jgi:hypothetical protein
MKGTINKEDKKLTIIFFGIVLSSFDNIIISIRIKEFVIMWVKNKITLPTGIVLKIIKLEMVPYITNMIAIRK